MKFKEKLKIIFGNYYLVNQDDYGCALDSCKIKSDGTMIGASLCQRCKNFKDIKRICGRHYIKCSKIKEARGIK